MDSNTTVTYEQANAQTEALQHLNQSKPVPRPDRNAYAELAHWQLQIAKPIIASKMTFSSTDAHTCKTPFEGLKPIYLKELEVPKVHLGRYLVCKVVGKPVARLGIHTLIQDLNGDVEEATFYNFYYKLDDIVLITVGTIVVIKEPCLQHSRHRTSFLRIESPSDVIFIDPADEEFLNKIGAIKWFEPMSKNAEVWRKHANEYFKNGKYEKALFLYERGLRCDPEHAVLHLNKSLACLKTGAYYDAYESAKIALEKGGDKEKALYRLGQAAYGMREWQKAANHFVDVLKENPNNADASKELKRAMARLAEEKHGKFDFKSMYVESKKEKPEMDVADFMGSIEVVDMPGKGRGVIALKDIQKGTLLVVSKSVGSGYLCDFPLHLIEDVKNDDEIAVFMLQFIATIQTLKNNPQKLKEIYDLYAGDTVEKEEEIPFGVLDVPRLEKICNLNRFQTDRGRIIDNSHLFILPSYFNHSCLANAQKTLYGDVMVIHAGTDIKKSEEICLPYISAVHEYSVRKELCSKRNFTCECKLCEIDSKDELYTVRYQIYKEFYEFADKNKYFPKKVLEKGEEVLKKIRQTYAERKEYKIVLVQMLYLLSQQRVSIDLTKNIEYMEELITLADDYVAYAMDLPYIYYCLANYYAGLGDITKSGEMMQKALKMSFSVDLEHLHMLYYS